MLELLLIYKVTIAAGVVLGVALTLLGTQLAARDRAMQTLCVGQGATLGVLLGIGVLHLVADDESRVHYSPLLSGALVSALVLLGSERWIARAGASKNTHFAAVFVALLAASSLVASAFPALESHLAQVFFGDLATLPDRDSALALAVGGAAIGIFAAGWRRLSGESFREAILGLRSRQTGFLVLAVALLCFSVQFVGFLFTAAALFLPTALLRGACVGLRIHLWACAAVTATSALSGFLLSLRFTRFPTVPTIVLVLVVTSFLVGRALQVRRRIHSA